MALGLPVRWHAERAKSVATRRILLSISLSISAGLALGCADSPTITTTDTLRPSLLISGQPDAGRHPYVGLLVFDDAEGPAWRCSGSLLSATVVLTAGHCTDGAVAARSWIDENVEDNSE